VLMPPKKDAGSIKGKRTQTNPSSLANLTHEGRPKSYDQPKERHGISVTKDGWDGFLLLAQKLGVSASELVELQGRGKINLSIKIKDLSSNEALTQLGVTPAQLMEMPLIEVLVRLSAVKEKSV